MALGCLKATPGNGSRQSVYFFSIDFAAKVYQARRVGFKGKD
jgi:hypothetical protein